jgi:predicted signal transduction protein with EAL and GGDEF domain
VARRLQAAIRATDTLAAFGNGCTVARHGGDEFTILLESLRDPSDAERMADRILAALSESFVLSRHEVFAGVSIGITVGDGNASSAEDVLREADTAMYHAKAAGRNRHRMFDPTMQQRAAERLQLEKDLRRALQSEEFFLHYQPILSLRSKLIVGFEALVRWHHPEKGCISPGVFIGPAEETGLIVPLGWWVLSETFRQTRLWQTRLPDIAPLVVSVNCSIRQITQPDFLAQFQHRLAESQVNPHGIKVEVTESTIMEKPEIVCSILNGLRELGVQISIDDFGTGYSSLAHLHRLPLDVLKVDRSFVSTLAQSQESVEIVRTIVTLGRSLRLEVVAEGVETTEQERLLAELGCTHVQGFLYSRPVNSTEATRLLTEQQALSRAPALPLTPTTLQELCGV